MPPGKRGKNDHGEAAPAVDGDRIGALLHHVLSFLPTQKAVQTCVLARRWCHLWKSATCLHIECDRKEPTPVKELQQFVDHLLLLRGCAPLETFELKFGCFYAEEDAIRLNLWIRHVVICQVRMLRVENLYLDGVRLDDLPLVSQHLTRLELVGVEIKNSFCNFSSCPSLEHLQITHCYLWFAEKISSESLKHLSIKNCYFGLGILTYVPNLVSLWLDGHLCITPVLESMPSLQEAFVRDVVSLDCDEDDCYSCYGIVNNNIQCLPLEGLSEAKNLTLISEPPKFIFERDLKQCPAFSKLKTLLLNDYWCVAPDFHALTCILKHSPVLEKLTLELFSKGDKHKVEMIERYYPMERSATPIISEHLKAIEVKCEVVNEEVYKVLKFLCTFNIYFLFR